MQKLNVLCLSFFCATALATGNLNSAAMNKDKSPVVLHGEALPAEWYKSSDMHYYFRVITMGDGLFDYRKPDYKGGFYLRFQLSNATGKEHEGEVPFDEFRNPPEDYVAHFTPAEPTDMGDGFRMPDFNVSHVRVNPSFNPATFDFANLQWQPYDASGTSGFPDPMMLYTRLNIYASEKQGIEAETKRMQEQMMTQVEYLRQAGSECCDMSLIRRLRETNEYDTIIHETNRILYINTDMEIYEQSIAPDIFHITYKKFYPNGMLKEVRRFLPGIYTSNCLPVGIGGYYDEAGELSDVNQDAMIIFPFPQMAGVDFLIRLLEYEGWIDRQTGKGKAVMSINRHVDPHEPGNGERLMIRSTWQIQADDRTDSTVGLLVRDGEGETAYIINKLSRVILDKFKR